MKIDPIFDRNRLKLHRDRSAKNITKHDFLIKLSSNDISDRIASIDTSITSILEIGARDGFLTEKLIKAYPCINITAIDMSEKMLEVNPARNKIVMDEEQMGFEGEKFDLIVSVLNIHHINDIKKFFHEISEILSSGGLFIASLFGGQSLTNLKSFMLYSEMRNNCGHSPHIIPFATASDIYRLLQLTGFDFVVTDTQRIDIEYENPFSCMKELRGMGESSNLFSNVRSLAKSMSDDARKVSPFLDCAEIITLTAKK